MTGEDPNSAPRPRPKAGFDMGLEWRIVQTLVNVKAYHRRIDRGVDKSRWPRVFDR